MNVYYVSEFDWNGHEKKKNKKIKLFSTCTQKRRLTLLPMATSAPTKTRNASPTDFYHEVRIFLRFVTLNY